MHRASHRLKISTTVDRETHGYLERLVKTGRAANLAEALDHAVLRARRADDSQRLEQDTAAYFEALKGTAALHESRLDSAVARMADEVDFGD
jgi:hypothetical protein